MRLLLALALAGCAHAPEFNLEAHCEALIERGEYLEVVMCASGAPPIPDLGAALYALGNPLAAAHVYGQLLSDDPLTVYNLAAVLHDAGFDVESLFELVLAQAPPGEVFLPHALLVLADCYLERGDLQQALRLEAQADELFIQELR